MTSESSFVQAAIPRFDGHYDHWSMLMENFLRSKEYWPIVEAGIEAPAVTAVLTEVQKTELEGRKLKDLKAKNYLFQAIDRPILETILSKETSKDIWDSMKLKYQGSTRVKRAQLQALRRDFETLQMQIGEPVTNYCARTMEICNKMRFHGEKMDDNVIVEKILRSLSPQFDYVACSIEESRDVETLSIDELQSSLLVHEQKMLRGSHTNEQALKATNYYHSSNFRARGRDGNRDRGDGYRRAIDNFGRGRGNFRGVEGNRNNFRGVEGQNRGKGDKSKIECFRCHKFGHYRSECYARIPGDKAEMSHFAERREEETLLMAVETTQKQKQGSREQQQGSEIWFVDTGCSNHMCGCKSSFIYLNEDFNSTVSFGDNSTVNALGKGDIEIRTKNGFVETISDVLYVPDLKSNLLSAGQLQEKGYEMNIKNGVCEIYDPLRGSIAVVKMSRDRLFPLEIVISQPCFIAEIENPTWLWHFRYGHLNFSGLKTLQQKNMVKGLPEIDIPSQVCEDCVVSKQHRSPFPQGKSWRAKHALELVHSDICGPISPSSNGGKKYLITFIDDFTRKTWVYFLQHKAEAFHVFQSFKAKAENEAGKLIKTLRTDRGGEFCSTEFDAFCEEHGIRKELTASYTPQQNGVSERKNRTILNMVRSLLARGKIPKEFWPEAVNWSIHVLNRSPTFSVQNMTPEEAWSGRKPNVEYFRIFGCIAYAHVPDEKRKKLDDKGERCVFLGMSECSKAYKLYNPLTKRIVTSRDVVFDEVKTWDWDRQQPIHADLEMDTDLEPAAAAILQQPCLETAAEIHSTTGAAAGNFPPTAVAPVAAAPPCPRIRKRPTWMEDYEVNGIEDPLTYFALFADCDPMTFESAVKEEKWRKAMDDEIDAIERNDTWELTDLPPGQKSIGVKWVFKTKLKANGEVDKYKARLVVKGYKQEYGIDYTEVFAPVARHDTIRLIIALAAQKSWPIFQLDVKSAFLHGNLEEQVFVDQPLGHIKIGCEDKVYRLKKALYGLKQAPRAWYSRIESYFLREGFHKCPYEHSLFVKIGDGGKLLIACLYVDDLLFTGNDADMFKDFKSSMMVEFEMSDLGLMHYFLGIEVMQTVHGIFISQKKYVHDILERFQMKDCNPVSTPTEFGLKLNKDQEGKKVDSTLYKQIVGSLMYLTATRPDIMYSVSLISRYMENPTEMHLLTAKRILRYLQGTKDFGLFYKKGEKMELVGFTDSDYAGDQDDRRSTSGFVFMMGTGAVSWSSKKQQIVTLSTTEAEFIAATACACQAIWIRRILEELQFPQIGATTVFCDNNSAIKLSKNPVLHGRSKHIDDRVGSKDFPCFDSYIVEEEGGSGGYGTVYRATRKHDGTTVAIKCPHENAHRHHVSNELRMLERFGGKNFVIKFEGCLKNQNSDCFVLEYVEHDRPEVLKNEIDVFQLRWYGYCMFRALASLHKQGVVHMDIKPGNFLFSCKANKGYLIDFNLALDLHQKLGTINKSKAANDVSFNSVAASNAKYVAPSKSRRFPGSKFLDPVDMGMIKGFKSTLEAKNVNRKAVGNIMTSQGADGSGVTSVKDATSARTPAERLKEPLPSQGRKELLNLLHEAMQSPNHEASSVPASMRKRIAAPPGKVDGRHIYLTPMPLHSTGITVAGFGLVKNKCDGKNKKEGPCVGTKGFRAPEVLFRSLHQGPKVDIWSAGVTLLYLIIGKTPFYGDPEQNIKDIAKLRGSEDLWEVSKLHNRESSFPVDLYNMQSLPPTTLWEWCKLNSKRQDFLDAVPDSLIDLVDKCLTVNPRLRISAEDALKHEFFAPCNESLRRQKLLRQGHDLDSRTNTPSQGQSIARRIKISQRQP